MLNSAVTHIQEDWVSHMFGHDLQKGGFVVEVPQYTAANDDYYMTDAEAEFDDFLSFIVDFQTKTKV